MGVDALATAASLQGSPASLAEAKGKGKGSSAQKEAKQR